MHGSIRHKRLKQYPIIAEKNLRCLFNHLTFLNFRVSVKENFRGQARVNPELLQQMIDTAL